MIPGIVAGAIVSGGAIVGEMIAFPLTYDEQDGDHVVTLTRNGDGPHITPEGFIGNGYDSRYRVNSGLPAWVTTSAGSLTVHAEIMPRRTMANTGAGSSSGDVAVYVGADNATPVGKLELRVLNDVVESTVPQVVAKVNNSATVQRMCRSSWRYEGRFPLLTSGGFEARPQAIVFLDSDTLLVTAHYEEDHCKAFKIRASDGVVLGSFEFDPAHHHMACAAERSDGSIWFCGTSVLLEVDIDASFSSGFAVVLTNFSLAVMGGASPIDWVTLGGTEYLVLAEYVTTGNPYLYLVAGTDIVDGGTWATSTRYKRFVCSQRMQGLRYHGGKLYTAQNRLTGDGSAKGKIQRIDLATAAASLADGDTLAAETTSWAPGEYVEDIDFHPTTGDLWTMTEGLAAVGDSDGWLALWSGGTDNSGRSNAYTLNYDHGDSLTTIKINNRLFGTVAGGISSAPAAISIGAPPQASAGVTAGFFHGTLRNVVIQNTAMTNVEYDAAVGGAHEASSLTVIPVTLTNPGAESSLTGWTNELGSLALRVVAPPPHSGAQSFAGGSNANTRARQRMDLSAATGLTTTEIDAGGLWGRVGWWQSCFSPADLDNGAMGLRFLNAVPTQISQGIGFKVRTLPDYVADVDNTWVHRSHALTVPSGARNVDALMDMSRSNGTALDCYIDDIALVFYRQ